MEPPEVLRQASLITSISLERTGCLGSCPAYVVTLHRNGRATKIARQTGSYEAEVHRFVFDQLARLLAAQGFFQLKPRYSIALTDQPSAIVTAELGRRTVRVEDYGSSGPVALWGMQEAIAAVVERLAWRRPGAARVTVQPVQLAAAIEQRLLAWPKRRAVGLPALVADNGLRRWAQSDARTACGEKQGGTMQQELEGPALVRIASVVVKDVKTGVEKLTFTPATLNRRDLGRLGVGAARHDIEGMFCVVAYLGPPVPATK